MTTSTVPTTLTQPSAQTRSLLRAGVVAGPFFVLASFAQMPFRDGFDLSKHAFSFLLIGPAGWLQAAIFVITGTCFALAGVGLRRTLRGRLRNVAFGSALAVGVGKVIAGLNAPQPSYGYPVGTPEGPPDVLTSASILHGVGFGLAVIAWIVLLVTLGIALRRSGRTGLSWLAFVVAAALPVIPATSGTSAGAIPLYVIATAAYLTTSVLLHRIAVD
jgi:hypothetical protein